MRFLFLFTPFFLRLALPGLRAKYFLSTLLFFGFADPFCGTFLVLRAPLLLFRLALTRQPQPRFAQQRWEPLAFRKLGRGFFKLRFCFLVSPGGNRCSRSL